MSRARAEGFTLLEVLTAFLIAGIVSLLLSLLTCSIHSGYRSELSTQHSLAILQLQELCASARSAHTENGELVLEGTDQPRRIGFDRHRLVCRPGYIIYMEEIDAAHFETVQGEIVLETAADGKKMRWTIR